MKPTISKPFKSNDRTFDKVFGLFNKKDYFNVKGLAKTQIGNFERALQKNDKNAQQVLDMFKGDERKAKEYILQVIHDRKKEQAFNDYKALKSSVDSIQSGKPNVGAVEYVKRIIHNNNQKYSIALYSTIAGKKLNNYKDIHKDIDSSIGEGFSSDAQRKAAFANGYEEKGKKKNESVNEGKKRYYQQDRVGSAKYTISYHDGKKKHKDGSDFFDIQTFRNKKDLAKFVNTLHKGGYVYGFNESVNEGKYNYKADALTAYFKGKIDAKELDRIARDDFKSGIATKKELSNFLSNKFTQDVMSDTYGIPAGTLIKRVRGLMKFAEGKDGGVPQGYNPMVEDKKEIIALRKKAKSEKAFYDVLDKVEKKYGKRSFELWLDKSLKDLKLNPKKYRTAAEKQEALFQTKL